MWHLVVAHEFAQGNKPAGKTTLFDTPSELFTPTVVTRENIAEILKQPGFAVKIADVCTAEYKAACTELGLS